MARITYTNKTTAATSPLPATQKLTSGDANEIKASVNAAYDQIEEVAGEVAAKDMVYLNDVLQAQTVTRVYTGLTDSGGEVTGSITGIATIVGAWGQPGMDAGDAGVRVFASLYSIDTSSYIFRCALADGNNPTIDTPVKVFIIGIPS